jgi:hypothetical protein
MRNKSLNDRKRKKGKERRERKWEMNLQTAEMEYSFLLE